MASNACRCGDWFYRTGYCCPSGFSFGRCPVHARYVRRGGGGAGDGSDWANAFGDLPPRLERDTVYWIARGNYGEHRFDDPSRGDAGILIRAATAEAHGTDRGWKDAYAAGPAVFPPLRVEGSYYTLDGGEANALRVVGTLGTKATLDIRGSHVVVRNLEIDGNVRKVAGKQTQGACNGSNIFADHVVFDSCEIHNLADDGIGIHGTEVSVLFSTIHNLHGCGTDSRCKGPCYNGHSDGIELSGASNVELVGNFVYDVRSTAALFMGNWDGPISDLFVYNNVFYTPETGITVYLQDVSRARVFNNTIWGRTQGKRYGGLAIGQRVRDLEAFNNIILNINFSHMDARYDPQEHRLEHNLFGMIDRNEYTPRPTDQIGDPRFVGVAMSAELSDHRVSALTLEGFKPSGEVALDAGAALGAVPALDIVGVGRPQGDSWDRGAFELPRSVRETNP